MPMFYDPCAFQHARVAHGDETDDDEASEAEDESEGSEEAPQDGLDSDSVSYTISGGRSF